MSIQMSGKGCSSCRFSMELKDRLEYLSCSVHPGKKRSYDYCNKREKKDGEDISEIINRNSEFKRVLELLRSTASTDDDS